MSFKTTSPVGHSTVKSRVHGSSTKARGEDIPPQSQVISRMTNVDGGLAASSAGHGLDHAYGSPDLSLSSSADSSVDTTMKANDKVLSGPVRVSIPNPDAHVTSHEMADFLSNSSDRKTSESGCSATSGLCRKPGPMTSSESSPTSMSQSSGKIRWGTRDGNRRGEGRF